MSSSATVTASVNVSSSMNNDQDDEHNEQYQKSLELVFEVVLMLVVGLLGIAGNVAAVILFSRRQRGAQAKFHRLMMMLSLYDLAYIVLSLLLFTIPQASQELNIYRTETSSSFSNILH